MEEVSMLHVPGDAVQPMKPRRIKANFAELDRIFAGLSSSALSWDEASKATFTGTGSPLYFVGYEMSKALSPRMGKRRFGQFFQEHPATFFSAYVERSHRCPTCVPGHFSIATEKLLEAMPQS